ncbi:hypothetical protein MKZ38_010725 [Zalerion maritima]|uniref:Uncharacterized protein n=1 Tax=Zalerion maritima TaxID=339359 RepID=A0AAD5RG30_9PEZI|nr:hypothetical protein MKZ38_010725 [Zalerion maritima]
MPPRIGSSTSSSLRAAARGLSTKTSPALTTPFVPVVSTLNTRPQTLSTQSPRTYATASSIGSLKLPDDYVPPTQPPSARRPEKRKSQLLRTYTSLLRSTPVILFFQHNNLTTQEWIAVRRELTVKMREIPQGPNDLVNYSDFVNISVLTTRLFLHALKVTEFYDPVAAKNKGERWTHDLSKAALEAVTEAKIEEESTYAQLQPLLVGPMAALTIPAVSPVHLAAALSILSPSPAFPAPRRKKRMAYHDPDVQAGLAKLMLVGGRVEGKVMDTDGVKWVGNIEGGVDSLRAQLVHVLQSAGMGLTNALETPGKSLWLSMESHRSVLEEAAGGGKKAEGEGEEKKV